MRVFRFIVIIMLMASFVISCTRASEETKAPDPDLLTGVYSLREFSPGFGPTESFNPNDVIWTFTIEKTLKVQINNPVPSNSQIPYTTNTTTTYDLSGNTVKIKEVVYQIKKEGLKVTLDAGLVSDVKRIIFDKIEI